MILLLPATQFQVMECVKQKANLYLVQLKEIKSPFNLLKSVSIVSELSHVRSSSKLCI